ncbi:MAG: CrtD protein, partial [Sphingomonas sp.]
RRSLSAMVWCARGTATGFPLVRHNVFFSQDSRDEFDDLAAGRLARDPSVYVCAQDRGADDAPPPPGTERFQIIVNAPATGDAPSSSQAETDQCTQSMHATLSRAGLTLDLPAQATVLTTPADFATLFPSTGGALYGQASHGWAASFRRPGSRTRIPGLYCAGGSTHPGAGVPMAALSARLAVDSLLRDHASMARSHPVAMPGGMSTRSARTVASA